MMSLPHKRGTAQQSAIVLHWTMPSVYYLIFKSCSISHGQSLEAWLSLTPPYRAGWWCAKHAAPFRHWHKEKTTFAEVPWSPMLCVLWLISNWRLSKDPGRCSVLPLFSPKEIRINGSAKDKPNQTWFLRSATMISLILTASKHLTQSQNCSGRKGPQEIMSPTPC